MQLGLNLLEFASLLAVATAVCYPAMYDADHHFLSYIVPCPPARR